MRKTDHSRMNAAILAVVTGAAAGGCVGTASAAPSPGNAPSKALYAGASDITIAQAFRPRIHFTSSTRCFPLSFQEISSSASSSDRDGMKKRCNGSYNGNFIVFASVKKPDGSDKAYWQDDSFRVTYGVATGWQQGTFDKVTDKIVSWFSDTDMGDHAEDAQYVTVDVVNDKLTSVWADMHNGYYSRAASALTMYNTDHVTAWMGGDYHPLKLVPTQTTACRQWKYIPTGLQALCSIPCGYDPTNEPPNGKSCGEFDSVMNWGDVTGDHYQGDGKLVMIEDVCKTTGTSYTSPDGITYSGTQLDAIKAYIGCSGASSPWSSSYMSKSAYSSPYSLKGCKDGDSAGGLICNGSNFGSDATWTTFFGSDRYLESAVAGEANPNTQNGTPFSDMTSEPAAPSSITLRSGKWLDAVSVTYTNGDVISHGGTGGSPQTISGLDSDPVVSVYLCNYTTGKGETVAGHIKLTTQSGRKLEGGTGTSNCKTVAPASKKLYGFYGRSGDWIDSLGTYWGNNGNFETNTTKPTASNVTIRSTGDALTSNYTFSSSVGYPEVGTAFQWFRISGTTTAAISGATGRSYTPAPADANLQVKFCVTPSTRAAAGNPVCSSPMTVVSHVTFYENKDFGGKSVSQVVPLNNSCVNLSSFDNKATSLKVIGEANASNDVTTVFYYKDANCSGSADALTAEPGQTASNSDVGKGWNDSISSYRLQLGRIIWFYENANYGGSHHFSTFNNGQCNDLSKSFNDKTSSLKIYGGHTNMVLTLYQDGNCSGTTYSVNVSAAQLVTTVADLKSANFNDKASSFKITW